MLNKCFILFCCIFWFSNAYYLKPKPIISIFNVNKPLECIACEDFMSVVKDLVNTGRRNLIPDVAKFWCHVHYKEAKQVCDGVVELWKPMFMYSIDDIYLSPKAVCGQLLGPSCSNETIGNFNKMWNVTLPNTIKPPVKMPQPPKSGSPVLNVLHISDVHIDYQYHVGASADCGLPLCCRQSDGRPKTSKRNAGYWGDYNCDLPWWTAENFFQQVSKTNVFDFIYFTGDLPDHHVWKQTRNEQITLMSNFTTMLKKYFPHTPAIMALGNHESVPVNSFPPGYVTGNQSEQWFYTKFWSSIQSWVPADQKSNVLRGGYFTYKILPNLRIVSLNMNYGNDLNWWMLHNTTDPDGQLQWFIAVLQQAEFAGDKVHILGHIPPSHTILPYSWNYYKILKRYESTIAGQFYGHQHTDQFRVNFDVNDTSRAFGVVYVAGSLTTTKNPTYRVYSIDGQYDNSTFQVLDYHNYIFNLTEANEMGNSVPPRWFLEYQATKAYNMQYLFPQNWANLIKEFVKNDALFQKFYKYYNKSYGNATCKSDCKKKFICDLKNTIHSQKLIPC